MSKPIDILGAPASNAGDAFHESWALGKALKLLDQNSTLTHVTVEGIRDAADTDDKGLWDGVDCALYYDDANCPEKSRVELIQLKYSVASKDKNWTLTRFCASTKKNGNNSVGRRLADAFKGASRGKTAKVAKSTISIKLVSNQPIAPDLKKKILEVAEGKLAGEPYNKLKQATGLGKLQLQNFCASLSLLGGELSRAELREENTLAVAELIQAPVKDMVDGLQLRIQERMGPEPSRNITKATVLSWFNLGRNEGLFPCEPRLEVLPFALCRSVSAELVSAVVDNPIVIFHGNGGCGKTTTVTSLDSLLPPGSQTIIYDCYGAGSYRDHSQPRHQSKQAFTQLSNEVARATSSPLFFPYHDQDDMAPLFRHKLRAASEVFAKESPDALLIIVVDAADNAVSQANSHTPRHNCFVHQLLTFEDLPANVRIVISSRTSRLETLELPAGIVQIPCPPFELDETRDFLKLHGLTGETASIEDFHLLSKATPRVQSNAINGVKTLEEAIRFLRPNGKSLPDLFGALVDEALNRGGILISRSKLSAALTQLPSPIPTTYLANVCGLSELVIVDLANDLASNLRLGDRGVEFSNEDFEAFCEGDGSTDVQLVRESLADMMVSDRLTSDYAAMHLFDALVVAGRKTELAGFLAETDGTAAISDPVIRRRTDLARLQAALHIVTLSQDDVATGETIFIGAEALRSAGKVEQVMTENADLSAAFIPETISSLILNNPNERPSQGPVLLQLSADKARQGKNFECRLNLRAANEWMQEHFAQKNKRSHWQTQDEDVVAQLIAAFILGGWPAVEADCLRWRPSSYGVHLRHRTLCRITVEKGSDAVLEILPLLKPEYRFLAVNCLSRAGKRLPELEIRQAYHGLKNSTLAVVKTEAGSSFEETEAVEIANEILFFLEICAGTEKITSQDLLSFIETIELSKKPSFEKLRLTSPYDLDLRLRFLVLGCRLRGEQCDLEKVFPKPAPPNQKDLSPDDRRSLKLASENYDEISRIIPAYNSYAKMTAEPIAKTAEKLQQTLASMGSNSSRSYNYRRVRSVLSRRATDILASTALPVKIRMTFFDSAIVEDDGFTDTAIKLGVALLHNSEMQSPVAAALEAKARIVRNIQIRSLEKSESLIAVARMFLLFSRENAEIYFVEALKIAEEVDLEALDVLHAMCRMVNRERSDTIENRDLVGRFARLVRFSGDLLQNEDGFPQREAVKAMTTANLPVAAMTVSRWSDEGFVDRDDDLNSFLEAALKTDGLNLQQLLLLAELPRISSSLQAELMVRAQMASAAGDNTILREILRKNISAIAPSSESKTDKNVLTICGSDPNVADEIRRLKEIEAFKISAAVISADSDTDSGKEVEDPEDEGLRDWDLIDPLDANAIFAMKEIDRMAGVYNYDESLLSLRNKVGFSDHVRHLDALAECARAVSFVDSEVNAILSALNEWSDAAVNRWRQINLPKLIVALGAKTLGYNWYQDECFEELQSASTLPAEGRRKVVTELVETNAFKLGSADLLKLLASFTCNLEIECADRLLEKLMDRLERRLQVDLADLGRYEFGAASLPAKQESVTAALLYRYLGDIDARVRWKASHALRLTARIQSFDLIGEVLNVAVLTTPLPYTFGDCPFQSMNADLHLAIVLARISFETPELVARFEDELAKLWEKCRPHILIGHFLARALSQARLSGQSIKISEKDLGSMNGSTAMREPKQEGEKKRSLPRHASAGERFHFDSMDVIPYWYNPALSAFAALPADVLIDAAENWIVDCWGGHKESTHWDKEPRHSRLNDEDYSLYSASHGSTPILHRHSMYLQWHGLFAAVGGLLQDYALLDEAEDDYDSFESWLERNDTMCPDVWIADVLGTVPLQSSYWARPEPKRSDWVAEVNEIDATERVFTEDGDFILYQSHDFSEYAYGKRSAGDKIRSKVAFVPTKTAGALLRAYGATTDYHETYLPERDDLYRSTDVNEDFTLTPAICRPFEHGGGGIDDQDPQGFGSQGIGCAPSQELLSAAGMKVQSTSTAKWYDEASTDPVIIRRSWNTTPQGSDRSLRHQSYAYVEGERLCINKDLLLRVMETLDCDLIMTMNFERSIGEYDDGEKNDERTSTKRVEVIHFNRDGRTETKSGHIGAW